MQLLGGRRGGGCRLMRFLVRVDGGGGLPGILWRRGINSSLILFWADSRRGGARISNRSRRRSGIG